MSASGMSVDPEKDEAVMSWERPKSVFEIRSFLGLAGYYRRFIEDFSRIAAPMTRLTRKEVKFDWDDRCEEAFQELKRRLTSALMSTKLIYVLSSFHMLFCAFYIHIHVKLIKFPLNLVL